MFSSCIRNPDSAFISNAISFLLWKSAKKFYWWKSDIEMITLKGNSNKHILVQDHWDIWWPIMGFIALAIFEHILKEYSQYPI